MPADKSDKPEKVETATYVIDRLVYHTPGQQPHMPGEKVEFEPRKVSHLVQAGFMHREGADPAAVSVITNRQQLSVASSAATVEAPPMPAPLNYETKKPDAG